MEIINRIIDELDKKGLTQADICKYIGIKNNVFTTWKTRGTAPPTKYLVQICDFLQITLEYLLTGKEKTSTTESVVINNNGSNLTNSNNVDFKSNISKKETVMKETTKELVRIFEALPTKEQIRLLNIAYDYEEKYQSKNNT